MGTNYFHLSLVVLQELMFCLTRKTQKSYKKKLKADLYLDHDSRLVTFNRYTKHINKIIRSYNAHSHILKGTYVNDSNDLRMWKFSIS